MVGPGDRLEHGRVGAGGVVAGERPGWRRGQLHGPSMGAERRCGRDVPARRRDGDEPFHYCLARVGDGGRGAGPRRRAAADDGRAARRPGRARAAAARRVRHRRRPRRGRRRRARRRSCGWPPSSGSTASARCRRRSSATSPRQLRPAAERIRELGGDQPITRHRAAELSNVQATLDAVDPATLDAVVDAARRPRPRRARARRRRRARRRPAVRHRPRRAARRRRRRSTAATSPSAASSPSAEPGATLIVDRPAALRALAARGVRAGPRAPGYTIVAADRRRAVAAGDGRPPLLRHLRRVGVAVRQPRRHAGAVRPARRPGGRAAAGRRPPTASSGSRRRGPRVAPSSTADGAPAPVGRPPRATHRARRARRRTPGRAGAGTRRRRPPASRPADVEVAGQLDRHVAVDRRPHDLPGELEVVDDEPAGVGGPPQPVEQRVERRHRRPPGRPGRRPWNAGQPVAEHDAVEVAVVEREAPVRPALGDPVGDRVVGRRRAVEGRAEAGEALAATAASSSSSMLPKWVYTAIVDAPTSARQAARRDGLRDPPRRQHAGGRVEQPVGDLGVPRAAGHLTTATSRRYK